MFGDYSDHDLTGVVVLYHVKHLPDGEDIVPLYVGYGNIYSTLRELENKLKFLAFDPIYYDYVDSPLNPHSMVDALMGVYQPILRN